MIQHTKKLLTRLEKTYVSWVLLGIVFTFFLLRLPSLFEPYWYGDEGIYQAIGDSLRHGKLLYVQTWDNKPPLLYVVYALFSSDQFAIRLASTVAGIISVLLFFVLARFLFKNNRVALITASIFALLYGTPIIEGIIANAENFIMVFVLAAAILVYRFSTSTVFSKDLNTTAHTPLYSLAVPHKVLLFSIGILVGIGFLFKIVALFDLFAFLFFLYLMHTYDHKRLSLPVAFFNQAKLILLGFVTPFLFSAIYFLSHNALLAYIQAAFFSNVGYVNYGNKFIIPQGFLLVKIALLLTTLFLLAKWRKYFSTAQLFILSWFVLALFNAYFSQRPYTHYLLVLLPAYILLLGLCLQQSIRRKWYIVLFLITLVFVIKDFDYFSPKKFVLYYGNFMQFASGKKSVRDYQTFFDGNTPNFYDVALFLKTHTKPYEPVFIWGNSAQIYVVSHTLHTGKYTVAYHITGQKNAISDTNKAIAEEKPKYIVIFDQPSFPAISLDNYDYKLTIDSAQIYERIP